MEFVLVDLVVDGVWFVYFVFVVDEDLGKDIIGGNLGVDDVGGGCVIEDLIDGLD